MNTFALAGLALQLAGSGVSQPDCAATAGGLTGVVAEISQLGTDRDLSPAALNASDRCRPQFSLYNTFGDGEDALDTPVRLATFSRLERPNDGTGQSSSLGVSIQFDNADVQFPSMAIVAGVDRRTVFLAPGVNGFQQPVVNLSDSLDVADGYGGVAWRLSPDRFVSVSYVRQERSFNSGMTEWREQDHFVGFVFNQRW